MKVNLLPTLFAAVGVPLTFGLGIWQVQRHLQKMDAHQVVAERIEMPRLSNADLSAAETAFTACMQKSGGLECFEKCEPGNEKTSAGFFPD